MKSICDNCEYNMCCECGIEFEIPELDGFDEINMEILEEDDDISIL